MNNKKGVPTAALDKLIRRAYEENSKLEETAGEIEKLVARSLGKGLSGLDSGWEFFNWVSADSPDKVIQEVRDFVRSAQQPRVRARTTFVAEWDLLQKKIKVWKRMKPVEQMSWIAKALQQDYSEYKLASATTTLKARTKKRAKRATA